MNDNINACLEENAAANATEEAKEARKPETIAEVIADDLFNGMHSLLFKRINNLSIRDARIQQAFSRFIKDVECGDSFSLAEILYSSEAVLKKGEPDVNAGNHIYCFDDYRTNNKRLTSKLLKYSVAGIYSLFALNNGVAVDIAAAGGSLAAAETKRFLVISSKKAEKFNNEARANGINLVRAGEMLSGNRIILTLGDETIANIDKSQIDSSSQAVSVTIGQEHFSAFLSGYNAVSSYALCSCVTGNNLVRFGLGCDLSTACARALGYFAAVMYLKLVGVRTVFASDNATSVAVPRPSAADGDYLYLLKLRMEENGFPEKGHYGQLYYYLTEKKRSGTIKDVLPVRENINRLINRLSNENVEYVPMAEVPLDCFGVIVSVPRGDSVNGVKLGYFKNI